jgi:hypothetical protein
MAGVGAGRKNLTFLENDMATTPKANPATTEARTPMAEPEGGWPADEYTGKGGSYVRDPYTGIRTPTPETAEMLAQLARANGHEA